jgi:glycosyltransferase involved in cell wall biosynthesis
MPLISVVIPVYKAEGCLIELYRRLKASLETVTIDFEILLIEDRGGDRSWQIISELSIIDKRVLGMQLSRNFGQHYAITAGLDFSKGDWVVVMDCDLQDRPEEIPMFYAEALKGHDIVVGVRATRVDSFFKKLASRIFYKIFDYFTGTTIDNRIGNFGIYSRKVIDSISTMREHGRSFGLFAFWVGFNRIEIEIDRDGRAYGRSSYTFLKSLHLAIDSIVSHSNTLLLLSVKLGFLMAFTSMLIAAWLVVRYQTMDQPAIGWTSLIVAIFFASGLIIGSIGTLGLYIGKIFDQVKGRPLYIVQSTTFNDHSPSVK